MCGLFGAISGRGAPDLNIIKILGTLNQERGEDSCGLAYGHTLIKGVGSEAKWTNFIKTNKIEFKATDHVVLGHVRKKTQGLATKENAHPFKVAISKDGEKKDYCITGAHNGNITNWRDMCRAKGLDPLKYDVDSHAVMALIGMTFRAGNYEIFTKYEGKAALMWAFSDEDAIYVFHGKSIESNYTLRQEVSEERPLHYWVDTKKNVTYFSSEAGPLEAIATNNDEVKSVPFNQIIKFTSNTMEVIADIPRDTDSYQFFSSSKMSTINDRKVDNGDFNRNRERNMGINTEIPFQMSLSKNQDENLIVLSNSILTDHGLSVHYESLFDLFNIEDRDELKTGSDVVTFIKSRYYRNGHLLDGVFYISATGKIANKKVNKKELTTSIREDGKNVQYSKYHFADGLLFLGEKDYVKYTKLVEKGIKSTENKSPAISTKPRLAHADFIKRVVSEGVKFLAPVSDLQLCEAKVYLPPTYSKSSANELLTVSIPFSSTRYIVKGNKLVALVRPDQKRIYVDKAKVIFSVSEKREQRTITVDGAKDLDIVELFEEVGVQTSPAASRRIPWQSLILDYSTNIGYAYNKQLEKYQSVLSFWAASHEEYNDRYKQILLPIQWIACEFDISDKDLNDLIAGIQNDKVAYNVKREEFFASIEWYKDIENFNIKNARDLSRITRLVSKTITTADVDEISSYTEPVNDNAENTTPVQGKNFLDLCQIAGRPKNKKASEEIDKDYFIDWNNELIWEPVSDSSGNTVYLFKSFHFKLKAHKYDTKPVMLTKILATDPFYVELNTEEFVDHLRRTSLISAYSIKPAFISSLIDRGFTIIGRLNDYDAMLEEMNASSEKKYETVDSYEAPVNGNESLEEYLAKTDDSYIAQKIKEENENDALTLRTALKRNLNTLATLISGDIANINQFLNEHQGYSVGDAKLTEYVNVLEAVQSKLRLFNISTKPKDITLKSLKDLPAVFEGLTKDETSIRKLAKRYTYTTNSENGDVITCDGNILRPATIIGSRQPIYLNVGTWEAKIENNEIVPIFYIDKGNRKSLPLEDLELYCENTLEKVRATRGNLLIINNNDIIKWGQLKKGIETHWEALKTTT